MRFFQRPLWSRLAEVGRPFFQSEARRWAWPALALIVVLLLTVNALNVLNSYVGNGVMSSLADRQEGQFYALAVLLIGVFSASTVVETLARYVEQRLGLFWRDWLTRRFLDRYLAGRAYHRLADHPNVDNPDQRISEDVRTFTASSLSFVILIFNAVVTFAAFAGVLWSITPWLFFAAVVYATIGSFGAILIGRRLVSLNNQQLKKEADFRYALGRVREHGGAVAQLGGEGGEKSRLTGRLDSLVDNFRSIIRVSRNLMFFTVAYDYMPQIIPVMLVAPLYIRRVVELGTATQAAMAFSQLLGAFSLIVRQFQDLSAYAAVAGRLGVLWEATAPEVVAVPAAAAKSATAEPAAAHEPAAAPALEVAPDAHRVAYEGVTLRTPHEGRLLVQDLTLEEPEGKRLLITGPTGAGKTALLLATAGLWHGGEGRIIRPDRVMFVPQHPYTAAGRLRDVLKYGLEGDISDDRLWSALKEVGLDDVTEQQGGLDAERDWTHILSWGEQRALAVARLLLAAPQFAFLDDTAEAMETHRLSQLYEALARSGVTYASVGVHPALFAFHDLRLELQGGGGWRVAPNRWK